ncbi:transposase domain-containing protein [Candidatus Sumerlaeota bacterium]|nr:transposase domain-containing protein [Candidatus Sumerlaeota bacterium]
MGRKNWLFAGSPRGGEAAATFFTLIDSCRRSGHNTFEYISDILRRIGDHPVNRLEELLPDRWTTSATPSAEPQAN